MADAPDSKSGGVHSSCGFESHLRHHTAQGGIAPHLPAGNRYGRVYSSPAAASPAAASLFAARRSSQ
jgi:hypothetical protein